MSTSRYAIAFNAPQQPGYMTFGVLPDTCATLEEAKILMAHRAEEWVDEQTEQDAARGHFDQCYEIQTDEDGEAIGIVDPDGGAFGTRIIHMIFSIQVIVV